MGYNRAINRKPLDNDELEAALADPDSVTSRVFSTIKAMLQVRNRQSAFHPNATQFTLQLGESLFGFWRQSLDRAQSVFAISNVTNREQTVRPFSLNLIGGDRWQDLLTGDRIESAGPDIVFAPYQTRWISNR